MTLRLRGSYSVSAAETPAQLSLLKPITCNVVFLDDKSELFKVDKHARGQLLLDLVFEFLELLERDFFGLQFSDYTCNPGPVLRWLDSTKTLKKQLRGSSAHTLWFRVKFYLPDPIWLQDELTRYQIFLQVRKDILDGSLTAPLPILAKLAGLCLQSELGDYSIEENKPGYVGQFRLIPNQNAEFEAQALEAHMTYRTLVPSAAELEYLNIARRLDLYGIHPQEVTDPSHTRLSIGVSAAGLVVFREKKRIHLYSWQTIEKISFKGKSFFIQLKQQTPGSGFHKGESSTEATPFDMTVTGKFNRTPTFIFDSGKRAKVFWQFAVTCHTFFRVKEPNSVGSGSTANGRTTFHRLNAISATAGYTNTQATSGFSSFFHRFRNRRSLSLKAPSPVIERTMSTLVEIRRHSRSIERTSIRRSSSRHFSRRRGSSTAGQVSNSALSVNLLNAYESTNSLYANDGVDDSNPFVRPGETDGDASGRFYTLRRSADTSTDQKGRHRGSLASRSSQSPQKPLGGPSTPTRGGFGRRFRASAPPSSRANNLDPRIHPTRQGSTSTVSRKAGNSPEKANTGTTPTEEAPFMGDSKRDLMIGSTTTEVPINMFLSLPTNRLPNGDATKSAGPNATNAAATPMTLAGGGSNAHTPRAKRNPSPAEKPPHAQPSYLRNGSILKPLQSNQSPQHSVGDALQNGSTSAFTWGPENTPKSAPPLLTGDSKNGTEFSEQERKISVASTVSSFDITNNDLEDGLVRVQIQPNSKGQFGFNFKGGADHGTPVLVSRVSSEMPAGMCIPRLNEGDQILFINGRDISKHTHDQVVNFIRAATEAHSGVLELLVQPRVYLAETIADKFGGRQIPDTGDAPPLPPKCLPEFKCSPSPPSPSWMPKSAQGFRPRPTNKPRLNGSVTARASRSGTRKPDITNTERLYQSIQELERGIEDGTIVMEFDRLERRLPTATTVDAKTHSNLSKNRYRDISPYDQTRVRIQGFSGDYINASFVKMELPKSDETNEYIAAQGPLPNTCIDFWQMCWEQNTHIIVMLTSVTEHGRDKCHKYWPALNKSFEFSWTYSKALPGYPKNPGRRYQMRIATLREEENNDFAYREFQLSRGFSNTSSRSGDMTSPQLDQVTSPRVLNGTPVENGFEARRLIQLQFINWPDHGVPDDPAHLITFVEKFRSLRGDRKVAAVVHCSAGIGRTGVVILLDTAIDLIKAGHAVFPLELVRQMRYYREMLIQTSAQFKFACESIVKYYYDFVRKRLPSSTR
uniref:protein-tyrosine-phosphatase n=1 Tax=Schistocephalus solidus TaxID=70667 RepID=A0A0V0J345_SCHSO